MGHDGTATEPRKRPAFPRLRSLGIVAGEASGDAHAAALVRALRRSRPDLRVWAVGGEALRAAGAEMIFPAEELSVLGVWEAAGRLPAVLRARARVLQRLDDPPDLFVPVDFGGLNLRLARAARRRGVPVAYYIPPKVWAWGPWRVRSLRASVDEALVILPFEEAFLRDRGVSARYVGSPVLDHLASRAFPPEADTVGLLPGSRPGEVARIWPLLEEVASALARTRTLRFLVPRAPGISPEALAPAPSSPRLEVEILEGRSQEVMERSRVCVVASGTATLECALVGTPLVAVYRVHPLTYAAGRLMVRVPFVSLPNLVAGRRVVPEFVQTGPEPVVEAVEALLDEGPRRSDALRGLAEVRGSLGERGASERAAEFLLGRFGGGAAA